MDGYQALALAIVAQALKDYQKVKHYLEKHPGCEWAKTEMREIEFFFQSDWFDLLSSLNPEIIMKLLQDR